MRRLFTPIDRAAPAVAVLVGSALLVASCESAGDPAPLTAQEWAGQVCPITTNFENMTGQVERTDVGKDWSAIQPYAVGLMGTYVSQGREMARRLRQVGHTDLPGGDDFVRTTATNAEAFADRADAVGPRIVALPNGDLTDLVALARTVAPDLNRAASGVIAHPDEISAQIRAALMTCR